MCSTKEIVQQMVFAWQDTKYDCREPIERALSNIGAERVGKEGKAVKYDGQTMVCKESVFPGDRVIVTQSGWMWNGVLFAEVLVKRSSIN